MKDLSRMKLDPFYPIFDSADWLERMLPLGVKLVQLRVKDRPEIEVAREIARAKRLCAAAGCVLVVNDYWKLAIAEGCDFLHLGQEDLDTADLGAIRKAGLKLGVSSHDEAELERALATEPDYVALGPVYPTILKQMRFGPQGLERLGEWKRRIGLALELGDPKLLLRDQCAVLRRLRVSNREFCGDLQALRTLGRQRLLQGGNVIRKCVAISIHAIQ